MSILSVCRKFYQGTNRYYTMILVSICLPTKKITHGLFNAYVWAIANLPAPTASVIIYGRSIYSAMERPWHGDIITRTKTGVFFLVGGVGVLKVRHGNTRPKSKVFIQGKIAGSKTLIQGSEVPMLIQILFLFLPVLSTDVKFNIYH